MAPDPLTVVVAERRAGDDREALIAEAGDREVALDPAPAVQHLRVGDLPHVARDTVVAEPLHERGGSRTRDLQLRERRLVEDRGRFTGRAVFGADRGRPVHPRPTAWPQRLVARRGVRLVPVHALPAGLLAERGVVVAMPGVGGRDAQRAAGLTLVVRVADVVVGLVRLADPRVRVGGGAVLRPEPAHVHVPEVERGLAVRDPLGHHLADPAGARQAVGAEPGCDEQAADLGLARGRTRCPA